ncbi:MAG TPA: GNAT family N-acetyltransferase [Fimbriimonadaceae bacterium]|jgi:ribosomal protein S18 acetylase RimI-like enzyme
MAFTIRRATRADAARIAEVIHASFLEFVPIFDPPTSACKETEETIFAKLENSWAFVAEAEGQIVGSVFGGPCEDYCYLFRLSVLLEFRKGGIGRALVERVEVEARSHHIGSIQLKTRLAVPKNIIFYESLGYEKIGEVGNELCHRPFFAVMTKDLV